MGERFETPEEDYGHLVQEGEALKLSCLAAAHGESGGGATDWRKAEEWCDSAEQLVTLSRMPVEARRRIAQALKDGTGAEIVAAIEAGRKQVNNPA
jgi:phosphoribosylformimino-5-aminoimidazole carboxamide ribonucleotide (ProFAR) isomerase